MTQSQSLVAVLIFGIIGTLFSGYLSIIEFTLPSGTSCALVNATENALGYPACVYGFVMFLTISVVASLGLRKTR